MCILEFTVNPPSVEPDPQDIPRKELAFLRISMETFLGREASSLSELRPVEKPNSNWCYFALRFDLTRSKT